MIVLDYVQEMALFAPFGLTKEIVLVSTFCSSKSRDNQILGETNIIMQFLQVAFLTES